MAKILVAGDFCLNARMSSMTSTDIEMTLCDIKSILQSVDYSLVNLECAVTNNKYTPITKCGPNLLNSSVILEVLSKLGFNAATLANNHIADFGHKAMLDTLKLLEEKGIDYVGGGKNLIDASKVLYKQISNKNVAFINCCEHEFTIATESTAGANPLNIPSVIRDILNAKQHADYVIVIVHGGPEHYNLPTPRMQDTYRFFIEMGADVVINHHQHCYSGYEQYLGGYIFYGIGNFCFDSDNKRASSWNKGYMVVLDINDEINVNLIPYTQCDFQVGVKILENKKEFFECIDGLSTIIMTPNLLHAEYIKFLDSKVAEYAWIYQLSHNRWLRKLNKLGLIPKKLAKEILPIFLTEERKLFIQSYFQCESHHEIMQYILQNKL